MSEDIFIPKNIFKKKDKTRKKIPTNIFAGTDLSIPDKIHIFFSDKIDIKRINDIIMHKFNILHKNRELFREEINILKTKIKKEVTLTILKDYQKKLDDLLKLFKDYSNNTTLNMYISSTKKFLEIEDPDLQTCEQYINICSRYINIEIMRKNKKFFSCKGCGNSLEFAIEEEENIYICPVCNCFNNFISPYNYIKDVEYGKSVDEDVSNFSKILDKFEGKNSIDIDKDLITKLDNFFLSKDLKKGSYYKNLPKNKEGRKDGTNKKMLYEALEYLNYSQYYDETNYITNIYWGWDLPDLSLYRDKLLKDYQLTQKVWNNIKQDYKRSASLGTQYRLYVHLASLDYPCYQEDFKIQDMSDSLRLHNSAWERMCKECNIKCITIQF